MARPRRVALVYQDVRMMQDEGWSPFTYGVHRVYAAALVCAPHVEVRLFRAEHDEAPEALVARLEAFDPDLVGASVFLWSFAFFASVAAGLKRARPDRTVVFGGPSAHPAMFALAPFREAAAAVDGLCTREGEAVMVDVLTLPGLTPQALRGVTGLTTRDALGFHPGAQRTSREPLDTLPSPFRLGEFPEGATAHLETFRGCPLSCAFCEWGVAGDASRVASREWLTEELATFRARGLRGAFLVDAGLNLSSRAFRHLAAAERDVGFFRDAPFGCEIYPELVKDEHLEFLSSVRVRHLGVGLQSASPAVLQKMQRPFHPARFGDGVRALSGVTEATIEIILGLPFDDLDSFRRTIDLATSFGPRVNLLAYHCLVLPDGLMTRSPAGAAIEFDPHTLQMQSCTGWSARDLERGRALLDELAARTGGRAGDTFWQIQTHAPSAGAVDGPRDAPVELESAR
ncbi:MAG: cobalamin-dependent protein, partial [Myxococcota bacterium]|nr:cobalamin-dependent protein [Myxococcota bacterium]